MGWVLAERYWFLYVDTMKISVEGGMKNLAGYL
jgi:hypothetical protein